MTRLALVQKTTLECSVCDGALSGPGAASRAAEVALFGTEGIEGLIAEHICPACFGNVPEWRPELQDRLASWIVLRIKVARRAALRARRAG